MNMQQLKGVMKHVEAPIQPFLQFSTEGYEKQIINLNPLCEKGDALVYQFSTGSTPDPTFLLVPDGCIDILFNCDPENPSAIIAGYDNTSRLCRLAPNTTYFGIKPYSGFLGLKHLPVSPAELCGHQIPLEDVMEVGSLPEEITHAESLSDRTALFQGFFQKRYLDDRYKSSLPGFISLYLCCTGGTSPLGKLCEETGYSSRYCRRMFADHYGLSIREYSQLLRVQRAMRALYKKDVRISIIACANGYFDEAHFINNFRTMVGMTPLQFRRNAFQNAV